MSKLPRLAILSLVAAVLALGTAGCKSNGKSGTTDQSKTEHPKGEHPKGDHPRH